MRNLPFPVFVSLLEYLTLHYSILFFRSYYYAQKWRFYFRFLLALYMLYIGGLLFRFLFAYYCLRKNKLELFRQWDPSIYSFMTLSFKKEKLMIVSFFGLIIHCINVIIFGFLGIFKYFSLQLEDCLTADDRKYLKDYSEAEYERYVEYHKTRESNPIKEDDSEEPIPRKRLRRNDSDDSEGFEDSDNSYDEY